MTCTAVSHQGAMDVSIYVYVLYVWTQFGSCSVLRFLNHRNLQLCFINSSDSEDEDEGSNKKVMSLPVVSLTDHFSSSLRTEAPDLHLCKKKLWPPLSI